jgi:hypothetical protein
MEQELSKQFDILNILRNQIDTTSYLKATLSTGERALLNYNQSRILTLKDERIPDLVLTQNLEN